MRSEIVGLLERADFALAACSGVVPEPVLERAAAAIGNARVRLSYPEVVSVVALVGGTGSGKSSLANALIGAEVALVGGTRPTTERALAIIPVDQESRMAGYLESMGIALTETHRGPDWLCLLDMPDLDSIEMANRHQVDAILPRVDIVVWVVDPEKYRDAVIHHRYLVPLAPYAGQFVFVLNQGDRLATDALEAVIADFQEALVEDGVTSATVVVTSSNPPSGPPSGVAELLHYLERAGASGRGLFEKLLSDLEGAAASLGEVTGGSGLDLDARLDDALEEAARLIASNHAGAAVDVLKELSDHLGREAGGTTRDRITDLSAGYAALVQEARATVEANLGAVKPRRVRWSEPSPARVERLLANGALERLRASVGRPLREVVRRRALANAAIADLSLALSSLRSSSR